MDQVKERIMSLLDSLQSNELEFILLMILAFIRNRRTT